MAIGELRYLEGVTTLELDLERCTGCGMCEVVCPHAVFVVEGGKSKIVDRDACMECGACAMNCPEDAISVQAGVGCATAVISGAIHGTQPACGCSGDPSGCS
jgi:ferredoxin